MDLSKFARKRYTVGVTPIEKMERLSKELGSVNVWIKRDDMVGLLASGGNKVRKLEFLMADALEKGADTIITCGAVQSNHCRLTLAAAVKEGLACQMVLEQRVPNSYDKDANGNNFLYKLMGVEEVHVVDGGTNMMEEMTKVADGLRAKGRKPYIIPGGGSNEIGALGYVACAQEALWQMFEMGISVDYVICTSGSAGTHAGLLCGFMGAQADIPVVGIAISRKKEPQIELVNNLCAKVSDKLGLKTRPAKEDIIVFDEYVGEGYSRPTQGMVDAVKLVARTEAILLDPVYTGKTMDGLLDLARKGYFKKDSNILFVHTGGSPSLYAYTKDFGL